ncbi:hypothetical protein H0H87_007465 [Tephrocybe sp. NHM501043]|nr:hypothetical protein H0H87_007465 [Tephrocybe sp. NHM501043]
MMWIAAPTNLSLSAPNSNPRLDQGITPNTGPLMESLRAWHQGSLMDYIMTNRHGSQHQRHNIVNILMLEPPHLLLYEQMDPQKTSVRPEDWDILAIQKPFLNRLGNTRAFRFCTVSKLTSLIQDMITDAVPIKNPSPFSKHWWSPELKKQKKLLAAANREAYQFYKIINHPSKAEANQLAQELAKSINTHQKIIGPNGWKMWDLMTYTWPTNMSSMTLQT